MKEKEKDFALANDEEVHEAPVVAEVVHPDENEDITPHDRVVIQSLEEHKAAFKKTYNKSRIVSYAASAIVLVIIIVAFTVIMPIKDVGAWAGIILTIVTLVASSVFSRYNRKKIEEKVQTYMKAYGDELSRISFADSDITNYTVDFAGKISEEAFTEAHFLKNIIRTNSRNLVMYDVGAWHVEYADYVAYRPDGKRAKSAFFGKYLYGVRDKSINGRISIYIKADPMIHAESVGPDDVDDLVLIEDTPLYRIHATNAELAKKISPEALEVLLKVKPNHDLADVSVMLFGNKIGVTLTYSEAIMNVPYKEEIDGNVVYMHKNNVTALNNFLTLIK